MSIYEMNIDTASSSLTYNLGERNIYVESVIDEIEDVDDYNKIYNSKTGKYEVDK